jgi:hypothetical protein
VIGWYPAVVVKTGVHRETVARYARQLPSKPANPIAGSLGQNRPNPIPGPASSAEPYDEFIQAGVNRGLTAQRMWQARVLRMIRDHTRRCGFAPFGDDTSTARQTAFEKIRARVAGTELAARTLGAAAIKV